MNRTGGTPIELADLLHVAYAAQGEVEAQLGAMGLSMAKLMALKALADAGDPLPLGQLAERLACVKSNITQLVDRLEADGLVARQPDERDRRTRLAALTAAGRKACDQGIRVQEKAEKALLGRLSAEEARQLRALLGKVGAATG